MLFNDNFNSLFIESDKERNLYYKILCGCVFNELIPNNKLGRDFIKKLIYKYDWTCKHFNICTNKDVIDKLGNFVEDFDNNNLNITFDFHLYRVMNSSDRGELADILISGKSGFISIEAKYDSNYDYKKDISANQNRIYKLISNSTLTGIQVLLIKKSKWINSQKQNNKQNSNYKKLYDHIKECQVIPFILMEWEDVLDIISKDIRMDKVCRFLADMINMPIIMKKTEACPFYRENWGLFAYKPEDDENKIYDISWCNAVESRCDSEDPLLCGTRKWKEKSKLR